MTKSKKPMISKNSNQDEIRKLQGDINNQLRNLNNRLSSRKIDMVLIIKTLQIAAIMCKKKIDLGSPFKAKTFGKGTSWNEACGLLYKAGLSHRVPSFFKTCMPAPSQSTDGANRQGREDTLFGGRIDGENAAAIVTGSPMPPMRRSSKRKGSNTGGPSKRGRRT